MQHLSPQKTGGLVSHSRTRIPRTFKKMLPALALGLACGMTASAQNSVTISGTVYNDANGGAIGGIATNQAAGSQIYVLIYDNSLNVIDQATVAINGTYSMTVNLANVAHTVGITTVSHTIGSVAAPGLNTQIFAATAEGQSPNGDGFPDFIHQLPIMANNSSTEVDFAFDRRPNGANGIVSSPSYNAQGHMIVPAALFVGTDPEDAPAGYPSNMSGRNIYLYQGTNSTVYYNGVAIPVTGTTPHLVTNFNPSLVSLAPGGAGNAYFSYAVIDNAGVAEAVVSTITVGNPLPVQFQSFYAGWTARNARLNWITASELHNDHFIVERSLDGKTFASVAKVSSKAQYGSSEGLIQYDYTDDLVKSEQKGDVYYRIRQVDVDGQHMLSRTIRLSVDGSRAANSLELMPNPAATAATASIRLDAAQQASLGIYSMTGALVHSQQVTAERDGQMIDVRLDVASLPAGIYMVRLSGEQGLNLSQRLVVNH